MSAITDIYDFEKVIAVAVAAVLNAGPFTARTQYDVKEAQEPRPRIEVIFKLSGQVTPIRYVPVGTGLKNAAWRGTLDLHLITDTSEPAKNTHGEYRANVRNFCSNLDERLNGGALTKHAIQQMVEGPTVHGFNPDKGYEGSTITFVVDFSVQNNAWSALPA